MGEVIDPISLTATASAVASQSALPTVAVSLSGRIPTPTAVVQVTIPSSQGSGTGVAVLALAIAAWAAYGTWSGNRAATLRYITEGMATRSYSVRFWDVARGLGYSDRSRANRFIAPEITSYKAHAGNSTTEHLVRTFSLEMSLDSSLTVTEGSLQISELLRKQLGEVFGPGYTMEPVADLLTFYHLMLQLSGWVGLDRWPSRWSHRLFGRYPWWCTWRGRTALESAGISLVSAAVTHRFLCAHLVRGDGLVESASAYREAYGVTDAAYADLTRLLLRTAIKAGWLHGAALAELEWRDAWTRDEVKSSALTKVGQDAGASNNGIDTDKPRQ